MLTRPNFGQLALDPAIAMQFSAQGSPRLDLNRFMVVCVRIFDELANPLRTSRMKPQRICSVAWEYVHPRLICRKVGFEPLLDSNVYNQALLLMITCNPFQQHPLSNELCRCLRVPVNVNLMLPWRPCTVHTVIMSAKRQLKHMLT